MRLWDRSRRVLGLNRGANLLALERREGTLPLLLLTQLTGSDIVLGKLIQALVLETGLLLAITPALVLPLTIGGLRWFQLGLVVLGTLNVLFFGLALGLFMSVLVDSVKAVTISLLLLIPWVAYSTLRAPR